MTLKVCDDKKKTTAKIQVSWIAKTKKPCCAIVNSLNVYFLASCTYAVKGNY